MLPRVGFKCLNYVPAKLNGSCDCAEHFITVLTGVTLDMGPQNTGQGRVRILATLGHSAQPICSVHLCPAVVEC